jgi:hypothetical protein
MKKKYFFSLKNTKNNRKEANKKPLASNPKSRKSSSRKK